MTTVLLDHDRLDHDRIQAPPTPLMAVLEAWSNSPDRSQPVHINGFTYKISVTGGAGLYPWFRIEMDAAITR